MAVIAPHLTVLRRLGAAAVLSVLGAAALMLSASSARAVEMHAACAHARTPILRADQS